MSDRVRFLLGDEVRELDGVDPTLTVLDWLRSTAPHRHQGGLRRGRLRRLHRGRRRELGRRHGCGYRAGQRLHPVRADARRQPAAHGREPEAADGGCIRCSRRWSTATARSAASARPGFVMSLFALTAERGDAAARRARSRTRWPAISAAAPAIAPIVDAAQRHARMSRGDAIDARRRETWRRAAGARDDEDDARTRRRAAAASSRRGRVDELAAPARRIPTRPSSPAATDVGLWVTKQHARARPDRLSSAASPSCSGSRRRPTRSSIGAGVTLRDAMARARPHCYPDLGELLRRFASRADPQRGTSAATSPTARRSATAAGADRAGATLVLRRGGERRALPLEDFFLAYGKQDRRAGRVRRAVRVPKPAPGTRFRAYKISKRFDQDISAVLARLPLELDGGAVARRPHRLRRHGGDAEAGRAAEAALVGKPWTEATRRGRAWRRWRRTSRRSATCAPRPATGCTVAREPAAPLHPRDHGATAATRARRRRGAWPMSDARSQRRRVHDAAQRPRQRRAARHRRGALYRRPARAAACCTSSSASRGRMRGSCALDLDAVRAAPGVVCVLTAADIPGENDISPIAATTSRCSPTTSSSSGASRCSRSPPHPRAGARAPPRWPGRLRGAAADPRRRRGAADAASCVTDAADAARAATRTAAIAAAPRRLQRPDARSAARSTSISKARWRWPCRARTATCTVYSSTQHPERGPAHGRPCARRARPRRDVECRRMGGGFGGKETQGNLFACVAALAAQEDRPRRQVPARPRRRHGHHRQAARLRHRLRGRLRRRRPHPRRST